jgi:hypothetical protein
MSRFFGERGPNVKSEASVTANRPFLLGLLLFLLLPAGCGEDCERLCEERKLCRGARTDADCAAQCEELEELVEDANCTEQFDSLNDCVASQEDLCDEDPAGCESQSRAYTNCMSDYCRDHDCT